MSLEERYWKLLRRVGLILWLVGIGYALVYRGIVGLIEIWHEAPEMRPIMLGIFGALGLFLLLFWIVPEVLRRIDARRP